MDFLSNDDQSILIKTSNCQPPVLNHCNLQFIRELIWCYGKHVYELVIFKTVNNLRAKVKPNNQQYFSINKTYQYVDDNNLVCLL